MISPHAVDWRSTDFQPGDIVVLGKTLLCLLKQCCDVPLQKTHACNDCSFHRTVNIVGTNQLQVL